MIDKIDRIFSVYIRLRDTNEKGFGKCITCDETFHYSELECGHFRGRRHMATRWHENNAHAQCHECNTADNPVPYIAAMISKYGADKSDEITQLSKQTFKLMPQEKVDLYRIYREKVTELAKQKTFKVNY
jgi:hypothetical protein